MKHQICRWPKRRISSDRLSGKRTGEVLVEMGLLTHEQVDQAIAEQRVSHKRIGDIALEKGWVTKATLMEALGRRLGVKYLDLAATRIDPVTADLISERDARRYAAVPVSFVDDHTLLVAMADPSNIVAIDDLRILTGFDIEPAIATNDDIMAMLSNMRPAQEQISEDPEAHGSATEDEASAVELRDIREQVDAAPVVKLVNGVLARAADEGASDIHFEPQAKDLLVRFRHDGVLHEIMTIPKRLQPGVLSRLKIMADLDIAERRVPQDGRIGLVVGGRPIDMRVASLPTVYGEKIVIRLLDRGNVMLRLEQLGFSEVALTRYTKSYHQALRGHPGHGPDRFRQVDHALRHAQHPQHPGQEHHHRRRPGRVPPGRHQPGADQPQGRTHVRLRASLDPALRPRHHHGRRDPRQGDRPDRRRVRA